MRFVRAGYSGNATLGRLMGKRAGTYFVQSCNTRIYDLIKLIRNGLLLCSFVLLADGPRHRTRFVFIVQRCLGKSLFGGMAKVFSGARIPMGHIIDTARASRTTPAALQGNWKIRFSCNLKLNQNCFQQGPLEESSVTGRLEPKEAPAWKRRAFRYLVSFPIIGLCLLSVFVVMFLILRLQVNSLRT